MVKDFELISTKLDSTQTVLNITNFDSFDEAQWYLNSVANDAELSTLLNTSDVRKIIISDLNYSTMFSYLGLESYLTFAKNGLNTAPKAAIASNKTAALATLKADKQITQNSLTNNTIDLKPAANLEPKTTAVPIPSTSAVLQNTDKAISQPSVATPKQNQTLESKATTTQTATVAPTTAAPKVQVTPSVPLFKNPYGFIANEPHYIALNILSGNFDFEKLKASIDAFNAKNYSMLNLKVTKDSYGKNQVVLIGSFADANIAKSYLFRIVKETEIYAHIKGTDYRNLLGSQRNLNVMMQKNAMDIYFEFMQEYYLK
jgi:hypothetical protein